MITLQINPGKYCSELINDRYQILEVSVGSGSYYIYDHTKNKNIYTNEGHYHFNTIDAAMAKCTGAIAVKPKNIAPMVTKPIVIAVEPVHMPVINIPVPIPVTVAKAPEIIINKVVVAPVVNKFAGAFAKFKKVLI